MTTTVTENNNNEDVEEENAEYMRVKRLYEIVKEGSATIRDFYTAYDKQKKKGDEKRRRRQGRRKQPN